MTFERFLETPGDYWKYEFSRGGGKAFIYFKRWGKEGCMDRVVIHPDEAFTVSGLYSFRDFIQEDVIRTNFKIVTEAQYNTLWELYKND